MRAPLAEVVVTLTSCRGEVPPEDVAPECEGFALSALLLETHGSGGIDLGLSKRSGSGRSLFGRHLVGDGRAVACRVRPPLVDAVEGGGEEAAHLARVTRERPIDESLRHHLHKEGR